MLNSRNFWRKIGKKTQTLDELIAAQSPRVWIVPDDLPQADSEILTVFVDRVGNMYSQPFLSNRPTVMTTVWGSHKVIEFGKSGASTYMACFNTPAYIIGDFTAMIVFQKTTEAGVQYFASAYNTGIFVNHTYFSASVGHLDYNATPRVYKATNQSIALAKTVVVIDNDSIRINGSAVAMSPSNYIGNCYAAYIGSILNNLDNSMFTGYMAYFVLFSGKIDAQKIAIEQELIKLYLS